LLGQGFSSAKCPGRGDDPDAYPTPRIVRAIIDHALDHGWDPTAIGGRHEIRADAELEMPGFRVTDLLRGYQHLRGLSPLGSYRWAGLEKVTGPNRVEALVDAPAAVVRERIGRWSMVEEVDGGHCRVVMLADQLEWLAMTLGFVGAEFWVLGPPEFAAYVRDWGTRFTRAT